MVLPEGERAGLVISNRSRLHWALKKELPRQIERHIGEGGRIA